MRSLRLVIPAALAFALTSTATSIVSGQPEGNRDNKATSDTKGPALPQAPGSKNNPGADLHGSDTGNGLGTDAPPAAQNPNNTKSNEARPNDANRSDRSGNSPSDRERNAQDRNAMSRDRNTQFDGDRYRADNHYRFRDGRWYYVLPDNRTFSYDNGAWQEMPQPYTSLYPPDSGSAQPTAPAAAPEGSGCGAGGGCGCNSGGGDCGCGCRHHHHRRCCG